MLYAQGFSYFMNLLHFSYFYLNKIDKQRRLFLNQDSLLRISSFNESYLLDQLFIQVNNKRENAYPKANAKNNIIAQ